MNCEQISDQVRAFIAEHVRSVVELECLLLLQRNPNRQWSAEQMGGELRIAAQWAEHELEDLGTRGIIAVHQSQPRQYSYLPKNQALRESIELLALDYAERRVSVIQLIYSKPSDPIQTFADAFLFRKERSDG